MKTYENNYLVMNKQSILSRKCRNVGRFVIQKSIHMFFVKSIYLSNHILYQVCVLPSHVVHEIVGKMICNFSSRDIDNLIDRGSRHDLSRISCRELLKLASIVSGIYGDDGLCYFVLHHYLDKIVSIMKGRFVRLFVKRRLTPKDLINEIRSGLDDEVSVFSVIRRYLYSMPDYYMTMSLRYHMMEKGYSKQTARRKAKMIFEIASECRETLNEASRDWEKNVEMLNLLEKIRNKIYFVITRIESNMNQIICILLTKEENYWKEYYGEDIYNNIIQGLNCVR